MNRFWCLTCDSFFQHSCQYAVKSHKIVDLEKKSIPDLVKEALNQVANAVKKKEEIQKHMKVESTDLTGELKALAFGINESISSLEKLCPLLKNCSVDLDLSDGDEPVNLLWMNAKELRNVIEVAKEDIENADKLLLLYKRTDAIRTVRAIHYSISQSN